MKKRFIMNKIGIFIVLIVICFSCKNKCCEIDPPVFQNGFCDVKFNKNGGNTVIQAIRDNWRFYDVLKIDSISITLPNCVDDTGHESRTQEGMCSDDNFIVEYKVLQKYIEPVMIEYSWFKIIKNTPEQISIIVPPNTSGRQHEVRFMCSTNGTDLIITQSAE